MFQIRDLSVLAYANGFTLWHYKTTQHLDTVYGKNFMADAVDMLMSGDMILISSSYGVPGARIVMVTIRDVQNQSIVLAALS